MCHSWSDFSLFEEKKKKLNHFLKADEVKIKRQPIRVMFTPKLEAGLWVTWRSTKIVAVGEVGAEVFLDLFFKLTSSFEPVTSLIRVCQLETLVVKSASACAICDFCDCDASVVRRDLNRNDFSLSHCLIGTKVFWTFSPSSSSGIDARRFSLKHYLYILNTS